MPNPTPVSVVLNPPNTPALISEFVINAPLIVQTINVKNKLDSLDSTAENLSQRVVALEARPLESSGSPSGDYVPTSRTVNSHTLTSNITITKSDLGLANVDNTSDSSKPVSTAQAAADAAVLVSANAYTDAHVGGASTTIGHSWQMPDPVAAGIGASFINTDDGTEFVSSGTAATNGIPRSGWMRRLPSGFGPTRAALVFDGNTYCYAVTNDKIKLGVYTTNNSTFAMHYYWNGSILSGYNVDPICEVGQNNDFGSGMHVCYTLDGTICLKAWTNHIAGNTLVSGIPAVAGYNTLVLAPVYYGGVNYWRFSYNGSATADVLMNTTYDPPDDYETVQAWGRGDNVVYHNGKGIDFAIWNSLLSNADMQTMSSITPGVYSLQESATTGPATIRIEASRFDQPTGYVESSGRSTMPIRGSSKPAIVYGLVVRVNIP